MKKYITFSLFIFCSIVVGVLLVSLISGGNNQNSQNSMSGEGQSGPKITGVNPNIANLVLSSAEIAKHNSGQSCWLLISGKIYDVTSFLNSHPGNASTILPTCGTDATAAYASRGGTGSHSSSATAMLAAYYIGDLNQNIGSGKTTTSVSSKTNTTTKTTPTPSPAITPTISPSATTQTSAQVAQTTLALTSTELAKHNSRQSCWLLISGKIYDVTSFLNSHPGNASTILPTCGTDATAAYASRGGTGSHSSSATAMLSAYYIGDLNQNVVTNPTNPTNPPIANPTFVPTTSRGDDEEFDD